MITIVEKHKIVLSTIALFLFCQLSMAQSRSSGPYDGIDSVNGIAWRFSHGFSMSDPDRTIRSDYSLTQSDYLVIANCFDSSVIYTFPWQLPQKCLDYYDESQDKKIEPDTIFKYFKICWKEYYNDLSNAATRDTVYINPNNSDVIYSDISEEDLFFKLKEKHYSPNSSDSIVQQFYALEEVKDKCVNGDFFRRKSLKMYSNGKPDGTWIFYDEQGNMIRKTEYHAGVIIKDETF